MNDKMNDVKNKIMSSKKLKYGTSAVVFSAVFVAFIILLNVVMSVVDSRTGGLYIDLTTKQLYTVSEASKRELKDIDKNVQIIFCMERDKLQEPENLYLNYVSALAEDYADKFDNISVVYKNRQDNPAYFEKFLKSSNKSIDLGSTIVYCESTGMSVVYSWEEMYKWTTNGALFAFDGENKLTSAILQVARSDNDMPVVGFVSGHGEALPNENLVSFFLDYGYIAVQNVDLKIASRETLAMFDLLIIDSPQDDFIAGLEAAKEGNATPADSTGINEIKKLNDYVFEDFGNVLFILGHKKSTSNKTNLYELLEKSFGVKVDDAYIVRETNSDICLTQASTGEQFFMGAFYNNTSSLGYSIHQSLSSNGRANTYFGQNDASMLTMSNRDIKNVEVSPIVVTSSTAEAKLDEDSKIKGPFPVLTVSQYSKIVDYDTKTANVFVCASSSFVNGLQNTSFANNDLFKRMISTTNEDIIVDIDFKVLDEYNIDVTKGIYDDIFNRLVIIIPIILALLGVIVYFMRKNK